MNIEKIMMSQTLERLFHLAQGCPLDVRNSEELRTALATCSMDLIDELDNNRIHFDHAEDKAMLMGLLVVTVDYFINGNLKNSFKPATRN